MTKQSETHNNKPHKTHKAMSREHNQRDLAAGRAASPKTTKATLETTVNIGFTTVTKKTSNFAASKQVINQQ